MGWAGNDALTVETCRVAKSQAARQLYIAKQQYEELEKHIKQIEHTEKREAMLKILEFNKQLFYKLQQQLDDIEYHLSR